jgi:hypothetical protein
VRAGDVLHVDHVDRKAVQVGRRFEDAAVTAYFSDRGRLFQSEGGRRFSVMADGVSI